jgi:hypothetical protein
MHKELNIGLQTFIPKQGEWNLIVNYKPILVLRFTYKIISKTLTSIIQPFLSSWIKPMHKRVLSKIGVSWKTCL